MKRRKINENKKISIIYFNKDAIQFLKLEDFEKLKLLPLKFFS